MKIKYYSILILLSLLFVLAVLLWARLPAGDLNQMKRYDEKIDLVSPVYDGGVSIEKALSERRSIRSFRDEPLSIPEISQMLWAAQGISDEAGGLRTAPSAGALYPLEVYLLINKESDDLARGIYKYDPAEHKLAMIKEGSFGGRLSAAALGQASVKDSPAVIVFSAVFKRTIQKYGDRGSNYVYMEAGHAAQNVYLQAVSLDLGTVVIGAFEDNLVKNILDMPDHETPLYLMPIGRQ